MSLQVRGLVPIIPTAFDDSQQVDHEATARLVRFAVDCGVHAVALPAFGSEFYKLGDEERVAVVATAVQAAGGAVPVVGMANHPGAPMAAAIARRMAAVGVDVIGLNLPRSFAVSEEDLLRYAETVAAATDQPLLIQDWNPGGPTVGADFCVKLRERCPTFTSIKLEEPMMAPKMKAIQAATGGEIAVLEGWGGLFLPELVPHGCDGSMPGLALADLLVRIWNELVNGHFDPAFALFCEVMPYLYFSLEHFEIYHYLEKQLLVDRGVLERPVVRDLTTRIDPYADSYFQLLGERLRRTAERHGFAWRR